MIASMLFKKVLAFLLTACLISRRCESVLHREPSHNMPTLNEALNVTSISQTGLIRDLDSTKNISLVDYIHPGYVIRRISGFKDQANLSSPFRLNRIQFTFESLNASKPLILQSIGTGYTTNQCGQFEGVPIELDYTYDIIRSITVGFDQCCITSLQVISDYRSQTIGDPQKNLTYKTVDVRGVLVGVQGRSGFDVKSINFKYKTYTTTPPPSTSFNSLSTHVSKTIYGLNGGTDFNKQYPGYYITKIVGYTDSKNVFYVPYLIRFDFIFTSVNGNKSEIVATLGTGYNPLSKQKKFAQINIDYKQNLIRKMIVKHSNCCLAAIEVIFGDGSSQKIQNSANWSVTSSIIDIDGYLTGVIGRSGIEVYDIRFIYKGPV